MANNPLVAARLPQELLDRLDAYVTQLDEERPGMEHTRSDAIKILLAMHLPKSDTKAERKGTKK